MYCQFGSETGLLEAVRDDLAEAGWLAGLARVFTDPDLAPVLPIVIRLAEATLAIAARELPG